jgi:hypothetical protein
MFVNFPNLPRLAASALLAAGLAVAAAPAARADVVFNNVTAFSDISDDVFGDGPLGQSFNAGNGGLLHDIALVLTSSTSLNPNGTFQVTLLADNGTSPGAQIVSLGSVANSAVSTSGSTTIDLAPVSSTFLTANTTYWVQLSELGPNGIEWLGSDDLSGVGVADSSFYDANFGVNPASAFGAFQMAVDVPEPGTVALFMSGLLGLTLLRRRAQDL